MKQRSRGTVARVVDEARPWRDIFPLAHGWTGRDDRHAESRFSPKKLATGFALKFSIAT